MVSRKPLRLLMTPSGAHKQRPPSAWPDGRTRCDRTRGFFIASDARTATALTQAHALLAAQAATLRANQGADAITFMPIEMATRLVRTLTAVRRPPWSSGRRALGIGACRTDGPTPDAGQAQAPQTRA